jgi:branched-chain amino acid aminotransferase
MSIAACCLHYGQAAFEGLKAFTCKDGKVRLFRPDENARRLSKTARHLLGPEVPTEMFVESCRRVVRDNIEFVPPYGTGGSLYVRPLYIGTSPQIGVHPSVVYDLLIMVMPVGAYYKGGLRPVDALVIDEFDRAAPKGMGCVKVAGNYAPPASSPAR